MGFPHGFPLPEAAAEPFGLQTSVTSSEPELAAGFLGAERFLKSYFIRMLLKGWNSQVPIQNFLPNLHPTNILPI